MYQQPQSKLLDYWKRTANKHLQHIHGVECPSLNTVLQQWPQFKDKDGYILVSIVVADSDLQHYPFYELGTRLQLIGYQDPVYVSI